MIKIADLIFWVVVTLNLILAVCTTNVTAVASPKSDIPVYPTSNILTRHGDITDGSEKVNANLISSAHGTSNFGQEHYLKVDSNGHRRSSNSIQGIDAIEPRAEAPLPPFLSLIDIIDIPTSPRPRTKPWMLTDYEYDNYWDPKPNTLRLGVLLPFNANPQDRESSLARKGLSVCEIEMKAKRLFVGLFDLLLTCLYSPSSKI